MAGAPAPLWPVERAPAPRPRRRLSWGPFAVAVVATTAVNLLLLAGADLLLDVGKLWAAFLAALLTLASLIVSVLGYTSGVMALRDRR